MKLQLEIIGVWLMLLAIFHSGFYKYFNWKNELAKLSLLTRQVFLSHTFFIALLVFLMGLLCWLRPNLLMDTDLGRILALGFSIFWGFRFLFQHFFYSPQLWKGKRFETSVHVFFSIIWFYQMLLFFLIYKQ